MFVNLLIFLYDSLNLFLIFWIELLTLPWDVDSLYAVYILFGNTQPYKQNVVNVLMHGYT